MIFVILDSTCIERVGYNAETREMVVEFVHGGEYTLTDVPEYHFTGICEADSAGLYWNENLKGQY